LAVFNDAGGTDVDIKLYKMYYKDHTMRIQVSHSLLGELIKIRPRVCKGEMALFLLQYAAQRSAPEEGTLVFAADINFR